MKKTLFLSAIIAFVSFVAIPSFASDRSVPSRCPKASALRDVRLNVAKRGDDGSYGAFNINTYGTNQRWIFIVGRIDASSQSDAISKANEALPTLSDVMKKPHYDFENNIYVCVYNVGYGYIAGAITTQDADLATRSLRNFR